jgi:ribonuclease PH
MPRPDRRRNDEIRQVKIRRRVLRDVPGSVMIQTGHTHVLCTASVEDGVPRWLEGQGRGWLTAEYDMLPASTGQRRSRNRGGRVDGRTVEIQRLIGRCLRSIVDFTALGERTIWLDCDVLQADGGTRTSAVTGAFVALRDAVSWARRMKQITSDPLNDQIAAVSVGMVSGKIILDLCYEEDSAADVDFNIAMTRSGRFVEVQGTAERAPFSRSEMEAMLRVAARGVRQMMAAQDKALGRVR